MTTRSGGQAHCPASCAWSSTKKPFFASPEHWTESHPGWLTWHCPGPDVVGTRQAHVGVGRQLSGIGSHVAGWRPAETSQYWKQYSFAGLQLSQAPIGWQAGKNKNNEVRAAAPSAERRRMVFVMSARSSKPRARCEWRRNGLVAASRAANSERCTSSGESPARGSRFSRSFFEN